MNRIEFNEVMKANRIVRRVWNDLVIEFGDTYYAVVEGNIPLEVANIIYEKYPGNPYGIRIDGGCDYWKPSDHPNLKSYHIDTKEGLTIFITEMKDYLARKQNLPEENVKKYDELMATINEELLKDAYSSISVYDWMKYDENKQVFFDTVSKSNKTTFGKLFRQAIEEFDKTINPYANNDIELDDLSEYLKKVQLNVNVYGAKNEKSKLNSNDIFIKEIKTGNEVRIHRNVDGFSYQLHYSLGDEQYLEILHYFSYKNENNSNRKGEYICLDYFGDKIPQKIDIRYNLTTGVVGSTYGDKTPITFEQVAFIYDELLKAAELAKTITVDNMAKNVYTRKLYYQIINNKK